MAYTITRATTPRLSDAIADGEVGRAPTQNAVFDALNTGVGLADWVDVASATTTDIGAAASTKVRITGTTTITGLGTVASGTQRLVRFAGALTLTYNATSLILPGAANITTAANDTAEFVSLGSGNWVCASYKRASGFPVNDAVTKVVATYAALTALTAATGLVDNGVYYTYARTTEEDGGAGFWRYDSASTATANGGTILAIDGGGAGRFFRLYDYNRVQAEWFGAVVGASAATNTAAINAALAVGPTYLSKAGSYAFGETGSTGIAFTMSTGYQFYPDPANVTLVAAAGTYTTFNVTGSYTRISGAHIDNASKTAGYDHKIVCGASGSVIETYFDDFLISSSTGCFTDSGSSTGVHYRTYIGTVMGGKATLMRGPGINWSRGWAFLSVGKADRPPDLAFDFVGSSSPNQTIVSIAMTGLPAGAGGAYIQASLLGSFGAGGTTSSQKGFVFTDVSDLWTAGSTADSLGGNGFLYDGCTHVNPSNSQAALCDGHQITFKTCAYVRGGTVFARGRAGVGSPTANMDGIRFEGTCSVINLGDVQTITNTGYGLYHTSGTSSEIHLANMITRTNTLRGIKTTSGGVIAFVGGLMNTNTVGNYDLGGALHSIHVMVNAAGGQVNLDGVGTG